MPYIGKSPTGSGVRQRYHYTATGGETSLSGADDNSKTLKFSDGEYVDVYLNCVLLVQGTDYGVGTANTISSLAALAANDIVEVIVYDIYNVAKINSEAVRSRHYFTATGGETSIGTSQISGLTFPANADIDVKLNGVTLVAGTDYNTTTANTVGGLTALTAGQVVEIVIYEKFQLADVVSKAAGGTYNGQVIADGGLDMNGKDLILDADGDTSITADTDDQIDIKIGGSDVASFTSNGLKMVSGKGIDFSATADTAATGASMASELLDDYEEGTWSPSDESGASQTFTYAGQPYYTKIGNIVTVQAFINVPSNSSGNAVQIGSLPFSIATDAYGSGSCFNNANAGHHLVYVDSGTGTFYVRDDNNSSMSMTQASTKFLCITVTYRAS
jgi:hypothetical protein